MFSYSELLTSPIDRVRHALGDTVEPGLRSDETYNHLLTSMTEADVVQTVAAGLVAEFSLLPDSISIPGGPSVSFRTRLDLWKTLASGQATAITGGSTSGISSTTPERAGFDYLTTEYYAYRIDDDKTFEGRYWVDADV